MSKSGPRVIIYDEANNPLLGQVAMAASLPVVIASDQSAVTVSGSVTITGTSTFAGSLSNNTAAPAANNVGVLPAIANAAAPTYAEGNQVLVSTDLAGALRITGSVTTGGLTDAQLRATPVPVSGTVAVSSVAGTVAVTGPLTDAQLRATPVPVSGTVSTVGTLSNNTAAPAANNVGALTVRATAAAPAYTEGNQALLSTDLAGSLRVSVASATVSGSLSNNTAAPAANNVGALTVRATAAAPAYTEGNQALLSTDLAGSLRVSVASATVSGSLSNNTAAPAANNIGALTVRATAAAPAYTEGNQALLSTDLAGSLRVSINGSVASTVSGNLSNDTAAPAANNIGALTVRATAAAPAYTEGNQALLSTDLAGALRVTTGANGYGGQVDGRAADGAAPVGNPVLIGGYDGTLVQTLLTDVLGRLIVAPAGTAGAAGLSVGEVTLAAAVAAKVEKTTYTEQTVNAQRSIASASALDTAAGTGARTVQITYLNSTGAGPFTETVTLNGVAFVNTVATNICFIEKMVVLTVGATGSNAGILTLRAAAGGGGVIVGTIAALDNRTLWAHHYVPISKTCSITSLAVNNTSTAVGNGCVFRIFSKPIPAGTNALMLVSDAVRVFGQSSNVTRVYETPLEVVGPAVITAFATPESAVSTVERAAIGFYDE